MIDNVCSSRSITAVRSGKSIGPVSTKRGVIKRVERESGLIYSLNCISVM